MLRADHVSKKSTPTLSGLPRTQKQKFSSLLAIGPLPRWATANAETKVLSAGNSDQRKGLSFKPGAGRNTVLKMSRLSSRFIHLLFAHILFRHLVTFFIAVSYNDGIKKFNQSNNSDIVKLPFQGMSTIFPPLTGLSMPSSKCTHTLFFFF